MESQPRGELSWFAPLSIDLVLKVAKVTVLHPFVAWMVPIGMAAQGVEYSSARMHGATIYASLLTIWFFLSVLNKQLAYTKAREVDLSDEVIVITGGASGMGLLLAE